MWRLPIDPSKCTYEVTPTKLISTNIRTSHLLGAKAAGFECWAEKSNESKTFWFFGHQSREYTLKPSPISLTACKQIVAHMRDHMGHELKQITWEKYGTSLKTSTSYSWPTTTYSTVNNFYVRHINVTIDSEDHSTIIVPGANFIRRCNFTDQSCSTERLGEAFWAKSTVFGGKTACHRREYKSQNCLLSNNQLRCPEANIVLSSLFLPYRCLGAQRLGLARLVFTNNTLGRALTGSSDYLPVDSVFHHLYEDTNVDMSLGMSMLAYQLGMCEDQSD
jgi:hypothetical protein